MLKRKYLLALLALLVGSANAQPPAVTVANSDRAAVEEVAKVLLSEKADIARLDALLVRLPEPTPMRAFLQIRRGYELIGANRNAEARAAVEEAVRLTPDLAGIKIGAADVLSFAGAPQRAADLWLEASIMDPDAAAASDHYFLNSLVERLRDMGDIARADRLDAKMGEVGVVSALASERSASALTRLKTAFVSGGADKARPMVGAVISPDDLLGLYVDRRFTALWPTIEQWAGPDFKTAHMRYLTDLRRESWGNERLRAAATYGRALNAANRYADTVTLFLPVLNEAIAKDDTGFRLFLAPVVATAMNREGREAEFKSVLRRLTASLTPDTAGLNLNVVAIPLIRAYEDDDWTTAAKLADEWVAMARKIGPEVNNSAIRSVVGMGACAHKRLGTTSKEYDPDLLLADSPQAPAAGFDYRACIDDRAGAKKLLLAALADPEGRNWALTRLQPTVERSGAPARMRAIRAFTNDLRADKDVRAAAERVGRILPKPVLGELPPGFDPLQTAPMPTPSPDSV